MPVRESRPQRKVSQRVLGNYSARLHYAGTRAVSSSICYTSAWCNNWTFLALRAEYGMQPVEIPQGAHRSFVRDCLRRVQTPAWRRLFFANSYLI